MKDYPSLPDVFLANRETLDSTGLGLAALYVPAIEPSKPRWLFSGSLLLGVDSRDVSEQSSVVYSLMPLIENRFPTRYWLRKETLKPLNMHCVPVFDLTSVVARTPHAALFKGTAEAYDAHLLITSPEVALHLQPEQLEFSNLPALIAGAVAMPDYAKLPCRVGGDTGTGW